MRSLFVVIACLIQTVAASNWIRFNTYGSADMSTYDSAGYASLETGERNYPYEKCIVNTGSALGTSFKWTEAKTLLGPKTGGISSVDAAVVHLDVWATSKNCGADGSSQKPTSRLAYDTFSILNTTSMKKSGSYSTPQLDYLMNDNTYLHFAPLMGIDDPTMINKLLLFSGRRTYYYQEGQGGTPNCPAQPSEVYAWSRRSAETADVEKAPGVHQLEAPQGTESARRSLSCKMYSNAGGSIVGGVSTACETSTNCMRTLAGSALLQQCGELEGQDICAQITVPDGTCCTHTSGADTSKFICSATDFSGPPQVSDFSSCSASCGIVTTPSPPPSPAGPAVTTGNLVAVDVAASNCLVKPGTDMSGAAAAREDQSSSWFNATYAEYKCTAGQPNKVAQQTFSVSNCKSLLTGWTTTSLPSCALVTSGASISSQTICSAGANCIGSGCEGAQSSGSNVGMIVGIVVAVLVVLGCIALAVYWYLTTLNSDPAPKPDPDVSVDHVELDESEGKTGDNVGV